MFRNTASRYKQTKGWGKGLSCEFCFALAQQNLQPKPFHTAFSLFLPFKPSFWPALLVGTLSIRLEGHTLMCFAQHPFLALWQPYCIRRCDSSVLFSTLWQLSKNSAVCLFDVVAGVWIRRCDPSPLPSSFYPNFLLGCLPPRPIMTILLLQPSPFSPRVFGLSSLQGRIWKRKGEEGLSLRM